MNCGVRPYLHDDFEAIRLGEELIAHSSVLLWPELIATAGVPADIHEELIEPLRKDGER